MNRHPAHNQHYFHPIAQAGSHQGGESATQHAQEVLSRTLSQQATSLPHMGTPYSHSLRTSSAQRRTSIVSTSSMAHHYDKHAAHNVQMGSPHTPLSQHGSLPSTPVAGPGAGPQLDMSAVSGFYGPPGGNSPYSMPPAASNYTYLPQPVSQHGHDGRYDAVLLGQPAPSRNVVGMMDTRGANIHSRPSMSSEHDFKLGSEHMSLQPQMWNETKTKARMVLHITSN